MVYFWTVVNNSSVFFFVSVINIKKTKQVLKSFYIGLQI